MKCKSERVRGRTEATFLGEPETFLAGVEVQFGKSAYAALESFSMNEISIFGDNIESMLLESSFSSLDDVKLVLFSDWSIGNTGSGPGLQVMDDKVSSGITCR